MEQYVIKGGNPLNGEVEIGGGNGYNRKFAERERY